MSAEYSRRYGRNHKTFQRLSEFIKHPPENIPHIGLTKKPICVHDELKIGDDVVLSYRNFYRMDKIRFAKWKLGNIPEWL